MLLSLGRTIYYGKAGADCAAYFLRVGHPTPTAFNPADHFLDIISINHRSEAEIQRTTTMVEALTAAWHDSAERKATANKRYSTEVRELVVWLLSSDPRARRVRCCLSRRTSPAWGGRRKYTPVAALLDVSFTSLRGRR